MYLQYISRGVEGIDKRGGSCDGSLPVRWNSDIIESPTSNVFFALPPTTSITYRPTGSGTPPSALTASMPR
jgi:hypothetical protein